MQEILNEIEELLKVRQDHQLITGVCSRTKQGKKSHLRVLGSLASCEAISPDGVNLDAIKIRLFRLFSKTAKRVPLLLILLALETLGYVKENKETQLWLTTTKGKSFLQEVRMKNPRIFCTTSSPESFLHY